MKIKGKDYKFVFDTGTENTYISKHAAEKLGLKTLDAYNGFHMAHIDSIVIGASSIKTPLHLSLTS
ncbi:retroviral-like aspartic protease family protein [Leyella lascolaii]|uniref:retroviral-like aspartic protease family protein n=1 Tax=Leyella lascolaii TaxID=1776379 RepID=UPI0025AE537C